jgi:hypothetical protein
MLDWFMPQFVDNHIKKDFPIEYLDICYLMGFVLVKVK